MASPVVAGTAESATTTAGTNHVLDWTGLGTVAAGNLLIIILDKGSTSATVNSHADWTELLDEALANGLYIAYRWATGGETAPTLVTSASTRSAEITYRITGAENPTTTAPQIGTTSSGTSATPDPPASAAPPSSKDYLFITFYGAAGEEADDDTWSDTPPTSYTPSPPRQKACGVAGTNLGGMIGAAERALTTGVAQNPGTFAKDVSVAWRAQTITIHPASAVPYSADLTTPSFAVTSQSVTRLNNLVLTLSTPAFAFVAQGVDRLSDWIAQISAASLSFVANAVTLVGPSPYTAELTTAAFSFVAQAVNRFNELILTCSTALFSFTGQANQYFQDWIANLSTASFSIVGQTLTYVIGAGEELMRILRAKKLRCGTIRKKHKWFRHHRKYHR